jgi:hypothetical protein
MINAGYWRGDWLAYHFCAIKDGNRWHLSVSNGSLNIAAENHSTLKECKERALPLLKGQLEVQRDYVKYYLKQLQD